MERLPREYLLALRMLARRDLSEAELARRLTLRGVTPEQVTATVQRLCRDGYLNDRRLAERQAEALAVSGRAVGPRLRQELLRRGIPQELAAEAAAGATSDLDEDALIAAHLAGRFARFEPQRATPRECRRVIGWLQRRGFSLAAIRRHITIPPQRGDHDRFGTESEIP